MFFSLLLATLDRSKEIKECLNSLIEQEYKNFEVIIIDQSENKFTEEAVKEFSTLCIRYYHVKFRGLSKARNFGLRYANGSYCCLLDDDAIYASDYLKIAKDFIDNYDDTILSGVIFDIEDHETPFINYHNYRNKKILSALDITKYCPSAALIFPTKIIESCGNFNERLGVGNAFAAGEETDFLLLAYDVGYKILFTNELIVYHPIKTSSKLELVYNHYLGKGALFKIDFVKRKKLRLLNLFAKNTVGMFLKGYILDRKNKKMYFIRKKGFIDGFKTYEL